ncbi:MAG: SURF1 family protein [Pseudomonadota bacterium]
MRPLIQAAFWPTIACLPALAILIALGVWQIQRLEWKEGLISRIDDRVAADPLFLHEAMGRFDETGDIEYLRVSASGVYIHDAEMYLFAHGPEGLGWHVITPFRTRPGGYILVNRGYVPDRALDEMPRSTDFVTITGLLRGPGEPNQFTPDNEPDNNVWYWRDLGAMESYAGRIVMTRNRFQVLPFFLDVEEEGDDLWPRGSVTRLDLPNRHLEYALTWFGMAVALTVVYVLFVRSRLRRRNSNEL